MQKNQYIVTGMTCENCARHVQVAAMSVSVVERAEVNFSASELVVESETPVSRAALAAALQEEGYDLA
ncbi:MAG: heavy-metal-associated domain-containing protein [Vulcanimicrobiaceae bacterium]